MSKISLTDAGQSFLSEARRILGLTEAARTRVQEAARGRRGKLVIADISTVSAAALLPVLRSFREQFPQVRVSLIELKRSEALSALLQGRIHFALFPDLGSALEPQFQSLTLLSCPMVVVLPSRHRLARAHREDLAIADLADETLLIPSAHRSPGYFDRLNELCTLTGFTPANTEPAEGFQNLLGMVFAGYGVAILPAAAVTPASPGCVNRRLRSPVPTFQLNLFWMRKDPSLVIQKFVALAKREAKRQSTNSKIWRQ